MRKTAVYIFLFIFSLVAANAQPLAIGKIDTTDLRRHLAFLSSDELSGRWVDNNGYGACKAADYLKSTVEQMRLKEGFPGFLQSVPLASSAPDSINSYIEIRNKKKKLIDKTLNVPSAFTGNYFKTENAPLVFAGFGLKDETSGYNDFSGIDISRKVVVLSTGTPASFGSNEKLRWNNQLEMAKTASAMKAGAAAVVLIIGPADNANEIYYRLKNYLNRENWGLANTAQNAGNNFIIATADWADKVLGEKGSYHKLLLAIAKTKKPNSFLVENVSATIGLKKKTKKIELANVVAVVEGSDPVLKNECVVFMAHYDHLGIDKTGDVFNGADDNGSGTVTLLELAEAFQNDEIKPNRSIVFLWVTAEEVGMLGSKFYTENPLFPMSKTVACINLDMVGRVFEPRDTVWNRSPKKVKDFEGIFAVTNNIWPGLKEKTITACSKTGLVPDFSLPAYFLGSSDQASFDKKGVAVLNLSTGYHADYHKPTDEFEKINFAKMKRVADLCYWLGLEIANSEINTNQSKTN
ncbi:MAG: M20/M25/M40 family metallo-hydrolase [Draconibacterium sp.]